MGDDNRSETTAAIAQSPRRRTDTRVIHLGGNDEINADGQVILVLMTATTWAADNQVTEAEERDGWIAVVRRAIRLDAFG